tara:strand:+ start:55 stop:948 length:894 start_codon:yes stop_codon:yes gene_type:complete
MNLKNLNVIFAGCARDCSEFLPKTLNNIKHYSSLFRQSYSIVIENGSSDTTKEILKENQSKNDIYLFCDEFNKLFNRTQRLESARNLIIKTIKQNENIANCDLFILMDLDDIGTYRINDNDILNAINFLFSEKNIAGVFANQLGGYYDMWSLRDKKYCDVDIWAEVFKLLMKNKNYSEQITRKHLEEAEKIILDKYTLSFNRDHSPIQVKSAFGGFGIYKMNSVLENSEKYKGSQILKITTKDKKNVTMNYQKCEHVNFNEGLVSQGNKLYVLPYLINYEFLSLELKAEFALKLMIK